LSALPLTVLDRGRDRLQRLDGSQVGAVEWTAHYGRPRVRCGRG